MNISEIRKTYPQYNDLSDIQLADKFHSKYYSDIPKDTFYSKIGIQKKSLWERGVEATSAESEMMSSPANAEILRTAVGGGSSWIPAGIIKAAGIVSGQREGADELANVIQEKITGTPQTPEGKLAAQQISAPFEKLSEKSQEYADMVYDKTGSPLLATATRVAGEAIPFVAPVVVAKGLKGIKGAVKAPEIDLGKVSEKPYSITPDVERVAKVEKPVAETPKEVAPEIKAEAQKVEPAVEGDIPIKAQEGVKAEIPKAETPIDGKPAKAAVDINQDLIDKGFEGLPENELSRYNPIQKAEEVGKAQELVSNPDFFEIAKGNKPMPQDVHPQVLFNIAINEATKAGNIDMLMDLAKSPIAEQRSLAAQQLGASAWEKPVNNIVKTINEVKKVRESKIKNPKAKEVVKTKLKEEMQKINLPKEDLIWEKFLSKIEC